MHVRLRSFRSRALLACVPATAMVLMGAAGTASAAHAPASSRAGVQATIDRLLSGWHPTSSHGGHWAEIRGAKVTAHNWSGYADLGSGFSSLTAKWTEPKVSNCSTNGPVKAAVFWIGIDGFSSGTVEQGGTGAICGQGTPLTYFSWWEMFPTNNIQAVGTSVRPGDNISASVVRTGTKYVIKVTDSTTSGQSFTTSPQTCSSCKNSSAEWIAEAPSGSSGELPLPKFTTWTVSSATVKAGTKSGTIKSFSNDQITMSNASPHNSAVPGSLNSAGNSFKDVWKA